MDRVTDDHRNAGFSCTRLVSHLLRIPSLALLALLAAFVTQAAELPFIPPGTNPLEKEQDLQEKQYLQEKIFHELQDNRRRVLEQSKKKAFEASDDSSNDAIEEKINKPSS